MFIYVTCNLQESGSTTSSGKGEGGGKDELGFQVKTQYLQSYAFETNKRHTDIYECIKA